MPPLLELKGLRASYGRGSVLHGIDLTVEKAGITTLLGANGAGKTTTLRAICNMMVKREGSVLLDGEPLEKLTTDDIARRGVAHVPDGRGTVLNLTVRENLRLGGFTKRAGVERNMARVFDYFPRLKERIDQQAGTLSGGEQQMLAIGRAIMMEPRLLLLDEPSFGLSPLFVKEIFKMMRAFNANEGIAILLVEQNASLALDLAKDACLIETGRVVMAGPSAVIQRNPAVQRAYLGAAA